MRKLEDLDFADDLALLTHRLEDMQEKIESLGEAFQRVGLKINKEKTKVTRANNIQEAQISIGEAPVEDVGEFVYLGSKISQSGGREEDIPEKTRKARQDFFFFFFFFLPSIYFLFTLFSHQCKRIWEGESGKPSIRSIYKCSVLQRQQGQHFCYFIYF